MDAVFGSYRLLEPIAEGGMGRVFVAEHTRLGRRVALKMLRSELGANTEAVKRFFAEARAVNRIKHENVIDISDLIENEQGRSYYIMELLIGEDLRALEDRVGVVPLARALDIAIQVARGLGAAHAAGIVHRDLKPDNIFLTAREPEKDLVKLIDFGVAKLVTPAELDVSTFKTSAGMVVGTPLYMSPEQAAGKLVVDHRSDIYALGVILFEMVTGQLPFRADSFGELLLKHMTVPPPRPSQLRSLHHAVPRGLEQLILACMEKEPRNRPQAMADVEQRLQELALGHGLSGTTRLAAFLPRRGRWRASIGAAATTLIVAGSLAAFVAHRPRRSQQAARQPTSGRPAAPAPRRQVEIGFASDPEGAGVFTAGAAKPIGVTPLSSVFNAAPPEGAIPARRCAEAPPGARAHHKLPNLDHDVVFNPFK